jgi:hypothetical protein
MHDIHDSIDAEFDLVVPPAEPTIQDKDAQETFPDEEEDSDRRIEIQLPEVVAPSPVPFETSHVPQKGLTAWLYHMQLKTQLSR